MTVSKEMPFLKKEVDFLPLYFHGFNKFGLWRFLVRFFPIQTEYGKIRTRKTPNTDTFYEVLVTILYYEKFLRGQIFAKFKVN